MSVHAGAQQRQNTIPPQHHSHNHHSHSHAQQQQQQRPHSTSSRSQSLSVPPSSAHERTVAQRPRIFFGPFQLLQTLGEGEFGKVKLGLHCELGEEVAIKLIKRSVIKDKEKMLGGDKGWGKVKREVNVLKIVKHPNIVALYDVIETEKYIGIVLEYASGGELFDHILAHRYLKERDARKIFAQLVSGVSYMHEKQIVHRDLKLENLLLDRDRNIIITDFGFANRFTGRDDDLMATSCGSPCYAAPELVVQDGKYQGNGVDVWSCGVILYAMLAGYLPFDDDPSNPEGDNINLLYKYILATPLTFPDWITEEPRDLLLSILVPDPRKRASLNQVKQHPWLAKYRPLFELTVDDLEAQAEERIRRHRQNLARRRQALLANNNSSGNNQTSNSATDYQMSRSQSSCLPVGAEPPTSASTVSSVMAAAASTTTSGVMSSTSNDSSTALPLPGQRVLSNSVGPTTSNSSAVPTDEDIPSSKQPSSHNPNRYSAQPRIADPTFANTTNKSSTVDPTLSFTDPRRSLDTNGLPPSFKNPTAASKRYTVQLEYDPLATSDFITSASTTAKTSDAIPENTMINTTTRPEHQQEQAEYNDYTSTQQTHKDEPTPTTIASTSPPSPREQQYIHQDDTITPTTETGGASPVAQLPLVDTSVDNPSDVNMSPDSPDTYRNPPLRPSANNDDIVPKDSNNNDRVKFPSPPSQQQTFTNTMTRANNTDNLVNSEQQYLSTANSKSTPSSNIPPKTSDHRAKSRHRKGMSFDRTIFSRLLYSSHSSSSSQSNVNAYPTNLSSSDTQPNPQTGKKRDSLSLSIRPHHPNKHHHHQSTSSSYNNGSVTERVGPRRKALSLVGQSVANIPSKTANRLSKQSGGHTANSGQQEQQQPSKVSSSRPPTSNRVPGKSYQKNTPAERVLSTNAEDDPMGDSRFYDSSRNNSQSKARKVMDWFRHRTLANRDSHDFGTGSMYNNSSSTADIMAFNGPPRPSVDNRSRRTEVDEFGASNYGSGGRGDTTTADVGETGPKVIITSTSKQTDGVEGSLHSPISTSGAQSNVSDLTVNSSGNDNSNGARASIDTTTAAHQHHQQHPPQSSSSAGASVHSGSNDNLSFHETKLNWNTGAFSDISLTQRTPPVVMKEITKALWTLGIDAVIEGDFKYRCLRRPRTKRPGTGTFSFSASVRSVSGGGSGNGNGERERGDRRSQSITNPLGTSSGSFRSFFSRRNSTSTSTVGSLSNSQQQGRNSIGSAAGADLSPFNTTDDKQQQPPPPFYGENDSGAEVRFTIEITKLRNLTGIYNIDIRRLKGSVWDFKTLYQAIIPLLELGKRD